jgi:trk system potassium uptake protein TrkH
MPRLWDVPLGRAPSLWRRLTPPQLFVGSFALLVLLGTLGLKLIPGLYTDQPLGWLDALFTATSAVCVTGLTVADPGTRLTLRGQAFLLLLIQVGGLGILTFTTLILLVLGGRLSLRQEALSVGAPLEVGQHGLNPRRLARNVVLFTLTIEAAGAAVLYLLWVPRLGWEGAAWPAVFHSVSAFCNAGFSTFSDNLMSFHDAPLTLLVIGVLIVAGGIGFLTMEELFHRRKARRERRVLRLSLHTRLVLVTTAVLLVVPWPLFCWLEWRAGLAEMGAGHRITNGLFMSVTARTAGYNAIDYAKATEAGNFLTILLMSVGGSPGGTAGGLKTTTFALLAVLAWSRYRGEELASVWGRSLRKETTDRAIGLFVVAFGVVTAGILVLTVTERATAFGGFLDRMFEAVSAFNTVGLTTGLTQHLSPAGRVVVSGLMFLGRVGPLAVAAALTVRAAAAGKFRYAYEEVAVG